MFPEVPPGPGTTHRTSLLRSFGHAVRGIRDAFAVERNLRIHAVAAVAAICLGLVLHLSSGELAVLVLTVALVLTAELLNSAIEATVDLASPQIHPLARRAKDTAAGAVLVAAVAAAAIGLILFLPHLLALR